MKKRDRERPLLFAAQFRYDATGGNLAEPFSLPPSLASIPAAPTTQRSHRKNC